MTMMGTAIPIPIPVLLDAAARRAEDLSHEVGGIHDAVMGIDADHAWRAKAVHEYRAKVACCGADLVRVRHLLEEAADGIRYASVTESSWVG